MSAAPHDQRVAIALGASLGDTARTLRLALAALAALPGFTLRRASRVVVTPPAGGVAGSTFRNAVVTGDWSGTPRELLTCLRALETRLGRRPTRRWADRVLDLDVILVGDVVCADGDLVVPHPRMRDRPFVLVPLAEVWPEAHDPRDGVRFAELPAARVPLPVVGWAPGEPPTRPTRCPC